VHDPYVVAFVIRRPWPRRAKMPGRRLYWPMLITVWHREPGGHDSGEVCPHYRKTRLPDGTWKATILHGWQFHVHHWKVQVHPAQALRRWLLTRCAGCGGPSRRRHRVNVSCSWDGPRRRWWRGEPGLYHLECLPSRQPTSGT
jgi:hypothetical protein